MKRCGLNWDTISDLPWRTDENHKTSESMASVWTKIWKFCESSDAFASAMPQLRQLVTGVSPWQPRFDPRSICEGFVMGKVALGQVFFSNWISNANSHSNKRSVSLFSNLGLDVKLTFKFNLVLRSRMMELFLHYPICLHGVMLN
jgi:hypothetical protein